MSLQASDGPSEAVVLSFNSCKKSCASEHTKTLYVKLKVCTCSECQHVHLLKYDSIELVMPVHWGHGFGTFSFYCNFLNDKWGADITAAPERY